MPAAKVSITIERQMLRAIDRWVRQGRYPNRSKAVQAAVEQQVERWKRSRLADELENLDIKQERALADERLAGDAWPAS
jgi:Arc/MetJ-type ribon-helix-helix transcriptional regulator